MAWMDDLTEKNKDVTNNPELRAQIEEVARNQGISFDEARDQVLNRQE